MGLAKAKGRDQRAERASRTRVRGNDEGRRCRQPPLSRDVVPCLKARHSSLADRVASRTSRSSRLPSRVTCPGIGAPTGPHSGAGETSLSCRFPFAGLSSEGSRPAGRSGKWERLRLAPRPHASSSLARRDGLSPSPAAVAADVAPLRRLGLYAGCKSGFIRNYTYSGASYRMSRADDDADLPSLPKVPRLGTNA
jgi:hypothetical protein